MVAISADVKQMSASGAQISQHLQQLGLRLQSVEEEALNAMNLDELEHMLDEVNAIRDARPAASGEPSPDAEREIKHLLALIRNSPHRFVYADENKAVALNDWLRTYRKQ